MSRSGSPQGARRVSAALTSALVLALVASACGASAGTKAAPGTESATAAASADPATAVPSTTAPPSPAASAGPLAVVTESRTFVDTSRPTVARPPVGPSPQRVLVTTIVRPAGDGGPWPLVVFGHGFAVSAATYTRLLDAIAGDGYVVAAPELPGSSSALAGRPDESDLGEEPCDLRFVAGQVEAQLAEVVRPGAVAFAGQSDGATAAAYAALTRPTCPGPSLAAVVAFSANPVADGAVDPTAAEHPALLAITGSADAVNPPSHTRALYEEWPGPAWLLTSAGDSHLAPATDSPRHAAIAAVVVGFLDATLAGRSSPSVLATAAAVPGLHLEQR